PMMATTIMISTNVKPELFDTLIFILFVAFFGHGVNEATGGLLLLLHLSFTNCLLRPCFFTRPDSYTVPICQQSGQLTIVLSGKSGNRAPVFSGERIRRRLK